MSDTVGDNAELVAHILFPELTWSDVAVDKLGTDGFLKGMSVQIKGDQTIAQTGNVYKETREKNKQDPTQKWRDSPCLADVLIFVTNKFAISIRTDDFMRTVEKLDVKEKQISPTSIGYLVPISELTNYVKLEHPWNLLEKVPQPDWACNKAQVIKSLVSEPLCK